MDKNIVPFLGLAAFGESMMTDGERHFSKIAEDKRNDRLARKARARELTRINMAKAAERKAKGGAS